MLAGAIFVAADDGGVVNGPVDRAVLGVAEALTTVGVQQVGGRYVTGANGGIGLQRNAHHTELQKARPPWPARGRLPRELQPFGRVGEANTASSKISRVGTQLRRRIAHT